MTSIPIVDIGISESREEGDWSDVARELDTALSEVGFVYLKNHGVSKEAVETVFKESKEFFALDLDLKLKCKSEDASKLFGYDERNENLKIGNKYRESFNMPPFPFEGMLDLLKPEALNIASSILRVAKESRPVVNRILKVFAKSLNLDDENYFIDRCRGLGDPSVLNLTRLKSCFYPYVPGMKAGTERCSTHADFGLLTLLWQDEGGGLEVLTKDDGWISAPHIPGTILINTGNLLAYWSGGRYPATIHRVGVTENEVNKRLDRQSLAYFVIPDDEVPISPLLTHQPNYKDEIPISTTVSVKEYMKEQIESVYKLKI